MKLVVIFFSSIFISCSAVERFEKLEERVESLEVKNRELDSNINYLAEKLGRLYAGLEELSGKVKQNLESISNLDVSLDTSKPHPAIPEPYLREDQELASKQGLKLRAELFRFLNSVTRGEFPMVLSSADNILKNQVSLEVQLSVLFWKFVSLIEVK
ncbi:MAG: hypothetical protein NZO16_05285, partial [Deltaproteobacteria bacterium]|nr:hypothetical protein [Deltaproteobacteria bacterium]